MDTVPRWVAPQRLAAINLWHRVRFMVEQLQASHEPYCDEPCDGRHAEAALNDLRHITTDRAEAQLFLEELPTEWPLRSITQKALALLSTAFAQADVPAEMAYADGEYGEVLRIAGDALERCRERCLATFADLDVEMSVLLDDDAQASAVVPEKLQISSTNDGRDEWMHNQKLNGQTHKAILAALANQHPEWDQLDNEQSVGRAIDRFCNRMGLPLVRRQMKRNEP